MSPEFAVPAVLQRDDPDAGGGAGAGVDALADFAESATDGALRGPSTERRPRIPLTFALQDASDMLAKLHHEHEQLEREVTSYSLFNFVVTAYHLIDWVERDRI